MLALQQIIFFTKIGLFWFVSGILFNKYAYSTGVIILAIALLIYFSLKKEEKYIFILSSVPMTAIFKISLNLPSSIIVLYFIYIFEYYFETKTINKKVCCWLSILFSSQIIAMIVFNAEIVSILSFIVNIIFCETAYKRLDKVQNKSFLFKQAGFAFSLIMCVNTILAAMYPNMAFMISYKKQIALDRAGRFAALNGDPNYYSQLVAVALCFIISIIIIKNVNNFVKIFLVCMFTYLLTSGLQGVSKSFAVFLLFLLFILVVLLIRNLSINRMFIIKLIFICIVGVIAGFYLMNEIVIPIFFKRSLGNTSLLSNRENIWWAYTHNIWKHPLIWLTGTGIMNGGNILARGYTAHNVYFELIAETGFIGISSIISILYGIFRKFKLLFKETNMLFIWALLITSFALSLSSNDAVFVLLPLVALVEKSK